MLNYDSGAAVTALPFAVAGDLILEKQGEFRVASGAVIPNLGKIKMKWKDESGVARSIRGHTTEVAKPLLSAAEVSSIWDSLLFEDGGILLERNSTVTLEVRAILKKSQSLAKASDFTEKETCITRTCELGMSRRSLHRSNQPRLEK